MAPTSRQDLSKLAQDALYVTVGLGVIAAQKAQVRRQELRKRFQGQVVFLGKRVEDGVKTVEERLEGIRGLVSRGAA